MLQGATVTGRLVETDGNIATGKGPAAAIDFASTLIRKSLGDAAIDKVRKVMLPD